jgi:hypothetical protein
MTTLVRLRHSLRLCAEGGGNGCPFPISSVKVPVDTCGGGELREVSVILDLRSLVLGRVCDLLHSFLLSVGEGTHSRDGSAAGKA